MAVDSFAGFEKVKLNLTVVKTISALQPHVQSLACLTAVRAVPIAIILRG